MTSTRMIHEVVVRNRKVIGLHRYDEYGQGFYIPCQAQAHNDVFYRVYLSELTDAFHLIIVRPMHPMLPLRMTLSG
jgi:hypothetical protein